MKVLIIYFLFLNCSILGQIDLDDLLGIQQDTTFNKNICSNCNYTRFKLNILEYDSTDKFYYGNKYLFSISDSNQQKIIQTIQEYTHHNYISPYILLIDINFDSYFDLAFKVDEGRLQEPLYNFWIYNNEENIFQFNEDFSNLCCNLVLDSKENQITTSLYNWVHRSSTEEIYSIKNNIPILIEESENSFIKIDGKCYNKIEKWKVENGQYFLIESKLEEAVNIEDCSEFD